MQNNNIHTATQMRRAIFAGAIQVCGGHYIRPHENKQPDPALYIASIHLDGLVSVGQTESQAQVDWFSQNAGQAAGGVAA